MPKTLLSSALLLALSAAAAAQQGETLIDFGQSQNQKTIQINQGGSYRLTGTSDKAQVWVNTGDEKVTLILDNLNLSNDFGSAIYIESSGDAKVILSANSKNTLMDAKHGEYAENQAQQNAPLYAKSDLKIEGESGALLTVIGRYKDGIVSKDDLDLRDATITIEAADDALYGKDSVDIRGSVLSLKAGDDGIKSDNIEREDKGFVHIDGSQITLHVQSDAIHAPNLIDLKASKINIEHSEEGIESKNITIHSGDIYVYSLDDAINIADGSGNERGEPGFFNRMADQFTSREDRDGRPPREERREERGQGRGEGRGDGQRGGRGGKKALDGTVSLLGGRLHIRSEGDGFDSNGNAIMSGGELLIEGPSSNRDGYIDVDGTFDLTGGHLLAMGSSGMAQAPSESSTQPIIQVNAAQTYPANAKLVISEVGGQYRYQQTMPTTFASFTVSTPELELGKIYSIHINDERITEVKLEQMVTRFGNGGRHSKGNRASWW